MCDVNRNPLGFHLSIDVIECMNLAFFQTNVHSIFDGKLRNKWREKKIDAHCLDDTDDKIHSMCGFCARILQIPHGIFGIFVGERQNGMKEKIAKWKIKPSERRTTEEEKKVEIVLSTHCHCKR